MSEFKEFLDAERLYLRMPEVKKLFSSLELAHKQNEQERFIRSLGEWAFNKAMRTKNHIEKFEKNPKDYLKMAGFAGTWLIIAQDCLGEETVKKDWRR